MAIQLQVWQSCALKKDAMFNHGEQTLWFQVHLNPPDAESTHHTPPWWIEIPSFQFKCGCCCGWKPSTLATGLAVQAQRMPRQESRVLKQRWVWVTNTLTSDLRSPWSWDAIFLGSIGYWMNTLHGLMLRNSQGEAPFFLNGSVTVMVVLQNFISQSPFQKSSPLPKLPENLGSSSSRRQHPQWPRLRLRQRWHHDRLPVQDHPILRLVITQCAFFSSSSIWCPTAS